jgi:hypothetical protein
MPEFLHLMVVMKMGQWLARICSHSLAMVVRQVLDSESAEIQLHQLACLQNSVDIEMAASSSPQKRR